MSSLNVGGEGELVIQIDASDENAVVSTLLEVSGDATFDSGATLTSNVTGLVFQDINVEVIDAGSLSIADGAESLPRPHWFPLPSNDHDQRL